MKKLIFLFFLITFSSHAQDALLDSVALSIYEEYDNLDSARKHPDDVVKLVLRKKKLKDFPSQILKFKNLQYLDLSKNEISRIPYSFGDLENLEIADLWSNNLDSFPETLKKLPKLKMMDLRNILIPQIWQDNIQSMLPNTLIYFSPACKCSW